MQHFFTSGEKYFQLRRLFLFSQTGVDVLPSSFNFYTGRNYYCSTVYSVMWLFAENQLHPQSFINDYMPIEFIVNYTGKVLWEGELIKTNRNKEFLSVYLKSQNPCEGI